MVGLASSRLVASLWETSQITKSLLTNGALLDALVPRSSCVRQIEFFRVDGDFAFIMGLETIVAATDAPGVGLVAGQPTRRRFTNVWKREGDTWRLYARHANVIADR